jgi:hypothetical protein
MLSGTVPCQRDRLSYGVAVALWTVPLFINPATSNAACLPGDLSPNCIGVYKVPIDDNIRSMVGTKEALK